jgi:hypothetical protein
MPSINARRACAAAALAAGVLGTGAATTSAATLVGVTSNAVTKAFSFYAAPNSKTKTLFNINGFSANARCSASGSPIVFGFSSGNGGDLLGHVVDGAGRVHVIHNTSFYKKSKGQALYPSSNDFDVSGIVNYEDVDSRVVTVTMSLDNSTTLNGRKLCTVYGTYTAS